MENQERLAIVQRAAAICLASTVVVVALKLVASVLSGSVSVLAEAMQSLLDIVISLVSLYTIRFASRPADGDHPYGHGKAELLVSAFQMVLVIATAGVIAWQASIRFAQPSDIKVDWGLAAMGYAAIANSCMILYLRKVLRDHASPVLSGEIEHLRSDTLASLGVFGGLVLVAVTGQNILDPIVAILFTGLGAFFAVRQLLTVLHDLMDGSLPEQEVELVRQKLEGDPRVKGYHNLRTRRSGTLRIVTLHLLLDDDLSFVEAHDHAEHVEEILREALGGALVTVHYEPFLAESEHQRLYHQRQG
ncbi:MAG: cation diffusion facilitator family transporter [Fimbriimonadaceae bacterium]|jgi:cation diffusion facilitator family transporter|nr:cation diffusion facilitator family transporter [Fimbriimonadaceae bacterium]